MISKSWIRYLASVPIQVYYKGIMRHWKQLLVSDLLRQHYRAGNLRQRNRSAVCSLGVGSLFPLDLVEESGAALFPNEATDPKTLQKYIGVVHKLTNATLLISVEFTIVCMILGRRVQVVKQSASLVLAFLADITLAAAIISIMMLEQSARVSAEEKLANTL